jgi:hypothetical protein
MAGEFPSSPDHRKRKLVSSESSLPANKLIRSSILHQLSKSERRRRKHARSPLERLPLEILVQIFIDSMEISLPQSSVYLAKALSSEWVISQYLTKANTLTVPQINRMMRCRFFNHEWLAINYEEFQKHTEKDDSHDSCSCDQDNHCGQEILVFPDHLIRSPWTLEKCNLYRNFAITREKQKLPRDLSHMSILLRGLTDAISEQNIPAVLMLLKSYEIFEDPCSISTYPNPLPHSILRKAIMSHGCDETIVTMLLIYGLHFVGDPTTSPMAINYSDVELWNWAEMHGEKGSFLIAMMKLMNDISHVQYPLKYWQEFPFHIMKKLRILLKPHVGAAISEKMHPISDILVKVTNHWWRCPHHTPSTLRNLTH